VSQNPNFITSVIEYENDDDDMDDWSKFIMPSLSVNSSTGTKTISTPPLPQSIKLTLPSFIYSPSAPSAYSTPLNHFPLTEKEAQVIYRDLIGN
jgi:hypothetical protein